MKMLGMSAAFGVLLSSAVYANTLYDASIYAQEKFCDYYFAKKCKVPSEAGAPPFKTAEECKKQSKTALDAGAELTKKKSIKAYDKCKAKIDAASDDCMKIMTAPITAPECMD